MASTQNARNNDDIRKLLATYKDPRRQRVSLVQYYQMRGKDAYKAFANTLPAGNLRQIATAVGTAMNGKAVKTAELRPGRTLQALKVRNAKINQKSAARRGFRELERGAPAITADRIRASKLPVPGDGNCLFYAVAQGMAQRRRGRFLSQPELFKAAMQLRSKVRIMQCKRHAQFFGGFLKDGHCRDILKQSTYGGQPEILALALLIETPIAIFESTRDPNVFRRRAPHMIYGLKNRNPPLFLLYTSGRGPNPELSAHYDLLHSVTVDRGALLPGVEWAPSRQAVAQFGLAQRTGPGPGLSAPAQRPNVANGGGAMVGMPSVLDSSPDVSSSGSSSFWNWSEATFGIVMVVSCVSSIARMARR